MKKTNKFLGIIFALISSGTFGMIPLFTIPLMSAGMGEISILFYRYLFSAIAIGILCIVNKKSLHLPLDVLGRLFLMSLVCLTTALALIYSYNYIASGIVTTIHFLYPVLVSFLMIIVYKEKSSKHLIIASLLTIVGVAALSWNGNDFANFKGILLALSTAVTYAFYIVSFNQKGIKGINSKVIIFYIMFFGSIVFAILAVSTTGISTIPDLPAWRNLLLLAFLPTIISNITLVKAIKYAGATTTSILGSGEPLVAVICGIFVFSEHFTVNSIFGFLIIISAVSYVIIYNNKKQAKAKTIK